MRWSWAAVLGVLAARGAAAAPDKVILRIGTTAPEGSPYLETVQRMARMIERNTGQGVSVRVLASGVLGTEHQMIADVVGGKLDAWCGSGGAAVSAVPEYAALELPFLFRNEDEVERLVPLVWSAMERAAESHGLRYMAFTHVGFRHLGSKVPVATLADLQKLKLRSQPNAVHGDLWRALGVRHTPLALPDVVREMEAGRIDAFDSATVWMFATGWHLQVRHLTLTAHIYQPGVCLLGPGAGRLAPAQRARLERGHRLDAMRRSDIGVCVGCATARQVEQDLLGALPGTGVTVTPVAPALRAEMERRAAPVQARWRAAASPLGRALLDDIAKHLDRLRR